MVSACCICKVESGQQEDVSFHKIPKNEELKQQWFLAIGHEVGKHNVVCSLHFTSDDFYKIYEGRRRRLLPTAVPSEALPSVKQTIQTLECNSAVPKDFTASEELQKKEGESLNVIPTTNRLFDDSHAPLIESVNVPLCVQNISEPTQPLKQTCKRKRNEPSKSAKHVAIPRYIGDIGPDDFMSDASWLIVKKYISNTKSKLKMMHQTIRRLQKRVNSVSDVLECVKEKGLLSIIDKPLYHKIVYTH